jgi:hypothetical protein
MFFVSSVLFGFGWLVLDVTVVLTWMCLQSLGRIWIPLSECWMEDVMPPCRACCEQIAEAK